MLNFVKYYEKPALESCSEEELVAAARDLLKYVLAHQHDLACLGEHELICCLGISVRPNTGSFEEKITKAFLEKTGKNWDETEYHAVHVPSQRIGGMAEYVIFKKLKDFKPGPGPQPWHPGDKKN